MFTCNTTNNLRPNGDWVIQNIYIDYNRVRSMQSTKRANGKFEYC